MDFEIEWVFESKEGKIMILCYEVWFGCGDMVVVCEVVIVGLGVVFLFFYVCWKVMEEGWLVRVLLGWYG